MDFRKKPPFFSRKKKRNSFFLSQEKRSAKKCARRFPPRPPRRKGGMRRIFATEEKICRSIIDYTMQKTEPCGSVMFLLHKRRGYFRKFVICGKG